MLVERMHFYVYPSLVTPGQLSEGLVLRTDQDAPFRLFGVAIWNVDMNIGRGFDGQIGIRFARPDGRFTQRAITAADLLFPGNLSNSGLTPNAAMVCPIRPGILYPPNSVITFDMLGLPTSIVAQQGVSIVFCGVKYYEEGTIWAPRYPNKFSALPYLDNLTITRYPSLNNIFTAQADSDFVWQAGVYTDFGAGTSGVTPIDQLVDLGVIVRDYTLKPYMSDYIPGALLFPFLNAQKPGFLFPEIYLPRNEQLLFDVAPLPFDDPIPPGAPVTLVLGLKGMKVYPQ